MARKRIVFAIIVVLILLLAGAVGVYALRQVETSTQQGLAISSTGAPSQQSEQQNSQEGTVSEQNNQNQGVALRVGSREFTATLVDNKTARVFEASLPITIQMSDVNRNEKAYDLPSSLPSDSSNPGRIENGDIMLYGSRTLVVFYGSFSTTYTYTRIGKVNDPSELKETLGSGNITVTFQED